MNVKLRVIQGKPAGKALLLGPGDYFFGRGLECQIRFNSDWVSRQHCVLRVTTGQVIVRDLGSRNGTLVNGELLSEQTLEDGDQIQIGPVVFEIVFDLPSGPSGSGVPPEVFRSAEEDGSDASPGMDSTVHHALNPPGN